MPYLFTRLDVGDYDSWKPLFDHDGPAARREATGYRLFRGRENPGEVFVQVEFDSIEKANAARKRLLDSGVLDRFTVKTEPTVVEEAETVRL
jgi:hypothetical protein